MFKMNPAMLRRTLEQLEQVARDHAEWHNELIRVIVCRLRCNPDDLAEDAHRRCRFGQWYYGESSLVLRDQSVFAAMESEHRHLHRIAAAMLRESADGGPITRERYDELVASGARVKLELASLRHEIAATLRDSDALTGAYGRGQLLPELREWRELAKRDVQHCCVAFMDVDHLKEINDTHGHLVGDLVLSGAVEYVLEHLRPYDKVFRYGGDEFVLLLPGTDLASAEHLLERIRVGFGRVAFATDVGGQSIHATASFGLALLDADLSVEESIERADRALLTAKAMGRNRACTWDTSMTTGTMLKWVPEDDVAE